MRNSSRAIAVFCCGWALLSASPEGRAAAPERRIDVYVTPYYQSATSPNGTPHVAVGGEFDRLLSSNNPKDIVAARDLAAGNPALVTPMTMMVLSIRLYDVGQRDESVFWFYAAKYRYFTLRAVLNTNAAMFGSVDDTIHSFATLAGPYVNGYAFCDVNKQQKLEAKAIDWVEQHPYAVLFNSALPATPGDRNANLKDSIAKLRAAFRQEGDFLRDPANIATMKQSHKANDTDSKFCWR